MKEKGIVMKVKSIIYTFLILFSVTTIISANENKVINRKVSTLSKQLDLTDEQTNKLREILIYAYKQATEEYSLNKDNEHALLEAIKARSEITSQQIKNILNKEQITKYEKIIKERSIITDKRALILTQRLCLTNEQALKIQSIIIASKKQIEEKKQSNSGDRRHNYIAMRGIMQNADKKIEDLLSNEQQEIYEKIKSERKVKIRERIKTEE